MFINFFKNKMIFIFLSLGFLVLLGCANENAPHFSVPNIGLSQASCLNDSLSKVEHYFDGVATPKEVNEIWDCYSYALKTFHKYVKGTDENQFTANELRNFLETYFLNSSSTHLKRGAHLITDALLNEMMGIKTIFLGGTRQTLTDKELKDTFVLIEEFRRISADLLPYTPLVFVKDAKQIPSNASFAVAEKAFGVATQSIVKLLTKNRVNYDIQSLTRLLSELHDFFAQDNPTTTFAEIQKYVPLFSRVKSMLFHSDFNQIESREWELIGRLFVQSIGISLRGVYYLSEDSLYKKERLEQVRTLISEAIEILRDGLKRRDNSPISIREFESVIKEYSIARGLPLDLSLEDGLKVFEIVVQDILNPKNKFASTGLSSDKLDYLQSEFDAWGSVQELLIENKEDPQNPSWLDMKKVLNTPWALSSDEKGRIIIDGSTAPTNLAGATRLNLARSLFKVLFRYYIKDPERSKDNLNLSRDELRLAIADLSPILVGLHLINKDDKNFDKRLYRDTGIFMPRSDGNKYIGYYELTEYLHFVYSGIDAGGEFLYGADESCRLPEDLMSISCFRYNLQHFADKYLVHLPIFLSYADSLPDNKWQKNIHSLEIINRDEGAADSPIKKGDVYATFVLLQYLEVFMLKYDTDHSGDLDLTEGLRAFKQIKNIIGDILGYSTPIDPADEEDLETLFTYMLKYGDIPEDPNLLDEWKSQKASWKIAADRGILLQLLAALQRFN